MPGTVITFYSYKGGVGRSFALANIAVLLARWGHRVLCVDWDLEAPGLHHYFEHQLDTTDARGVVDLVDDFRAGRTQPADYAIRLSGADPVALIPAGRDHVEKVQRIDWGGLYDDGFGEYLERCREQWTSDYDFVLLDSRTGVSDIAGICTAHLPDRLVALFTANQQSVGGAVDIARRANVARDKLPFDRPALTVLPVLSRFDTREEYDRSEDWRRTCVAQTKDLFANWLDMSVPVELMSRHLTLPYVSYWSFGEQLSVLAEPSPGPDQISFALETIAAVIAHDFDRTDLLAENRDAYVAEVRTRYREFRHDLLISTPRPLADFALKLVRSLDDLGIRAKRSLSGERSLLDRSEDDARHLCLLVDTEIKRWQSAQLEQFVRRSIGQDRRVIPVLTGNTPATVLPGYVGNLRDLRLGPLVDVLEVARYLANELNGRADEDGPELRQVLSEVAEAQLRPLMWELVGELLGDMFLAVSAANRSWLHELVGDLAVVLKRDNSYQEGQVPAPPEAVTLINQLMQRSLE
ncbi:MAG TPA: AAA family ATPase [Pseudonocardiaceae bacterium]|jgi:MinD-like ATPase involved in chromosome partitioning or flagellar assembly